MRWLTGTGRAALLALGLLCAAAHAAHAGEVVVTPDDVRSTADLQAIVDGVGPGGVVWFEPSTTPYDLSDTTDPVVIDEPVALRARRRARCEACMPTFVGSGIEDESVGFLVPPGTVVDGVLFSGLRFRRFHKVIGLDGIPADGEPGRIAGVVVERCVFDGHGFRGVELWGSVSRTRIARNVFRSRLPFADSVSIEAAPRPDGWLRPDRTLVACNRFVGPSVGIQSRRAHRTLAVCNHVTITGGLRGGIGIAWGGTAAPFTEGDCERGTEPYDPGALVGNTVVSAPDDPAVESGWIGILAMGPDAASRGVVVGNRVRNFRAGIAVTLIASGMLVAENRIDSTFADIVIGNAIDTPKDETEEESFPFDTDDCPPSSDNAVLASAHDRVIGAVGTHGNVVVRDTTLRRRLRARISRELCRLRRLVRGTKNLGAVFDEVFTIHGFLDALLRRAR